MASPLIHPYTSASSITQPVIIAGSVNSLNVGINEETTKSVRIESVQSADINTLNSMKSMETVETAEKGSSEIPDERKLELEVDDEVEEEQMEVENVEGAETDKAADEMIGLSNTEFTSANIVRELVSNKQNSENDTNSAISNKSETLDSLNVAEEEKVSHDAGTESNDNEGTVLENDKNDPVNNQSSERDIVSNNPECHEQIVQTDEAVLNGEEEDASDDSDITELSLSQTEEGSEKQTDDADTGTVVSSTLRGTILTIRGRKRGRGKKRRWSSGKGWTPNKYRRSSSGSPRKASWSSAGSIKNTGADAEADRSISEGDRSQEEEGSERLRRSSRTPQHQNEFLVGDQAIKLEMSRHDTASCSPRGRKRRNLLIDSGRKASLTVKPLSDAEAEQYKVPFTQGWRREIVIRGIYDDDLARGKKNPPADVYYFPPTGPKLRSMVQIAEWLSKSNSELTPNNFSFMRRPIGIEDGEVIRHAAASRGRASMEAHKKKRIVKCLDDLVHDDDNPLYDKPEIVIERDSDEFLTPIITASLQEEKVPPLKLKVSPFKGKVGRPPKVSPAKTEVSLEVKQEKVDDTESSKAEDTESTAVKKFKPTARKSTTQKIYRKAIPGSALESLCSMSCPGLGGVAPMLHCNVCMCLFHHECVNYFGPDADFVCLRCFGKSSGSKLQTSCSISSSSTAATAASTVEVSVSMPVHYIHPSSIQAADGTKSGSMSQPSVVQTYNGTQMFMKQSGDRNSSRAQPTLFKHAPTVTSLLTNQEQNKTKSPYQEIRPAIMPGTRIKQEPVDDSYDTAKNGKGLQASTEALGNLKSVLNSRLSNSHLSEPGSLLRTPIPNPVMESTVSLKQPSGKKMPAGMVTPPSNINHLLPRTLALSNNAGIHLVPVGPPVQFPRAPFQPVQVPGLVMPSLIPITNIRSTSTTQSPGTSNLFNWPSKLNNQSKTVQAQQHVTMAMTVPASPAASSHVSLANSVENTSSGPVVVNAKHVGVPMNGQLLTLPPAVVKRLALNKPLALKINNRQINVPPSGFFQTPEGLKVFLPPDTFPAGEEICMTSDSDRTSESGAKFPSDNSPSNKEISKGSPGKLYRNKEVSNDLSTGKKSGVFSGFKQTNMQSMLYGFECMMKVFQYLNVRDLLTASQVCRSWRCVCVHQYLWQRVSLSGVRVPVWQKAVHFLRNYPVKHISFHGLLQYMDTNRTWHGLCHALQDLVGLRALSFSVVPACVLESVCSHLPKLEVLSADYISDYAEKSMCAMPSNIDIGMFKSLKHLKELRLKGGGGLRTSILSTTDQGGFEQLQSLTHLEILSLLSIQDVASDNFTFLSTLPLLQDLSLGDCLNWTAKTYAELGKCVGLRKLRLEQGGSLPDVGLGEALSKLEKLEVLELCNYKLDDSFKLYLSKLPKLRRLLLWPDNTVSSSEINTNTLTAVEGFTQLESLTWVVPSSSSESIILDDNDNTETLTDKPSQQWVPFLADSSGTTEYIGVSQLTEKLRKSLPHTKIQVYCSKTD